MQDIMENNEILTKEIKKYINIGILKEYLYHIDDEFLKLLNKLDPNVTKKFSSSKENIESNFRKLTNKKTGINPNLISHNRKLEFAETLGKKNVSSMDGMHSKLKKDQSVVSNNIF